MLLSAVSQGVWYSTYPSWPSDGRKTNQNNCITGCADVGVCLTYGGGVVFRAIPYHDQVTS